MTLSVSAARQRRLDYDGKRPADHLTVQPSACRFVWQFIQSSFVAYPNSVHGIVSHCLHLSHFSEKVSSPELPSMLFVGCLTSQQHASASQGRICSDNATCCHTEIEAADPTFCLTQSQYTDTGPTSPSADPITPGAWQGSHWSADFEVTGMTRPRKNPVASGIRTRDLPLSRRKP